MCSGNNIGPLIFEKRHPFKICLGTGCLNSNKYGKLNTIGSAANFDRVDIYFVTPKLTQGM